MEQVVSPGLLVCTIVRDIAWGIYVGHVIHQAGLLQVASGPTAAEVERLLPEALASRLLVGTLEPYNEDVRVVTVDIAALACPESPLPGAAAGSAFGQRRLNARDMDRNPRLPAATYETNVVLVEILEELELWYVQDDQGNRFVVDKASEVHVDVTIGTKARALVTAEGYALKLFHPSNG